MISCIWRGNTSWLSGKLCGWLLGDLHSKQLYSESFRLEVDLPSSVCCNLQSLCRTCVDRWDPVCSRVPSYSFCPTDLRIEQCQAQDSTSGSNRYKEGDQTCMLLGLTEDHGCGTGPGSREQQTCTARGQVAGAPRMSRHPTSPFPKVFLFHCIIIHKWHSQCVQKIAKWIFPPT